ncbi:MAG: hypothetical protein K2J79_09880 [Ruminiclostridium sp.]|nr:hypothetical protein [Ruminiclostridium sp.]
MKNKEQLLLALQELKADNRKKQKRGLHFIIASVVIWVAILVIHISPLPILTKNLYTFFCSAPLVPLAYLISKLIRVDFQNKDNPLSGLGVLFAVNQILYILIAMWVFAAVPDKMLMVYAIIFGAHLLPYGWLFQSKTYYVLSVIVPIAVLILGLYCHAVIVAAFMLITEVVFCCCLIIENRVEQHKAN